MDSLLYQVLAEELRHRHHLLLLDAAALVQVYQLVEWYSVPNVPLCLYTALF